MGLFKGIAQTVQGAVDFQILALLFAFAFFLWLIQSIIRKPKGFYDNVSEEPLHDNLKKD